MDEQKLNYILSALKGIDYGSVVITIHNGHITQVDTTKRLGSPLIRESPGPARKAEPLSFMTDFNVIKS